MRLRRNDKVRVIDGIDTVDPQYGIRGLTGIIADINEQGAQVKFRHGYNRVKLERLIKLSKRR